jgi:predicted HTH transcriptional regulator
MKNWIERSLEKLKESLHPVPQELNELDWKLDLSPNKAKVVRHLAAFANYPGGGFLIFGIEDKTGTVVGIDKARANEIIEKISNYSRENLEPNIKINHSVQHFESRPILVVYINESPVKPVHLKDKSIENTFIRNGGSTQAASRHDVGSLLLNSKQVNFEELHASKLKSPIEIIELLDYKTILDLLGKPAPKSEKEIMKWMMDEKMIEEVDDVGYYITNFGALAAARNLNEFEGLARKNIRLIKYKGKTKVDTEKEFPGQKGYAVGFEGLISFLMVLLPSSEIIKDSLRKDVRIYPEIALREIIANALIHQDFTIRGSGPMIEVFDDRIEISNPGRLLPSKKIDRLIRTTPESRNEILASAFRRFNICEERGSGLEKAVTANEIYGLPPIRFTELEKSFRVTIFAPRSFANMTLQERIDATYQHAVLKYFAGDTLTNSSLRERFKMSERQRPQISKLIREALEKGVIKPKDEESKSSKFSEYIPYWA